jgi:hypothetical protein
VRGQTKPLTPVCLPATAASRASNQTAVHLCIDMQQMFADETAWHVPWMKRVLPASARTRACSRPGQFHRFIPPMRLTKLARSAVELFGGGAAEAVPAVDVKVLHAKIGELTLENDFLAGALGKAGLLSAKR